MGILDAVKGAITGENKADIVRPSSSRDASVGQGESLLSVLPWHTLTFTTCSFWTSCAELCAVVQLGSNQAL